MPKTKDKPKKPANRPQFEITDKLCEQAKELASQGLTQEQIALSLGMGERTLYEKKVEYPQFAQAIKEGKAKGIATIVDAVYNKARNGDVAAFKYWLNNRDRDNWGERSTMNHEGNIGLTNMSDDALDDKIRELEQAREQSAED